MKAGFWPYPKLFAHRGGGSLAPENTLAAIRTGQSLGYRAHEIDVKLTRDGHLVLLHDPTLERTTTGKGRAADLMLAELQALDAGSWHSAQFAAEKVPTFEEATRLFQSKGTTVNIEIKPTPGFDNATGRAAALATRALWKGARVPPFFSSFSFEALMSAKETAPEIARAWLIDRFTEADWARLEALQAVALHTHHAKIAKADIARLREAGYRVNLYTVNEPDAAAALFEAGADALFTDNLSVFAERFPDFI